jgi:hypothetical protein
VVDQQLFVNGQVWVPKGAGAEVPPPLPASAGALGGELRDVNDGGARARGERSAGVVAQAVGRVRELLPGSEVVGAVSVSVPGVRYMFSDVGCARLWLRLMVFVQSLGAARLHLSLGPRGWWLTLRYGGPLTDNRDLEELRRVVVMSADDLHALLVGLTLRLRGERGEVPLWAQGPGAWDKVTAGVDDDDQSLQGLAKLAIDTMTSGAMVASKWSGESSRAPELVLVIETLDHCPLRSAARVRDRPGQMGVPRVMFEAGARGTDGALQLLARALREALAAK